MKNTPILSSRNVYMILVCAALVLYARGISIPYYADDFQFVFDDPGASMFRNFYGSNELNYFYRPLQTAFLALNQMFFSDSTVFIHFVQIILHATLCWLVFRFMMFLGRSFPSSLTAAVFMLISQANVHAVLSNDTFSQLTSTLAGAASLFMMYRFLSGADTGEEGSFSRPMGQTAYIWSVLLLFGSLVSKESGAGYALCALAMIVLRAVKERPFSKALSAAVYLSFPILVVLILYAWLRFWAIPVSGLGGDGTYGMQIGSNILRNIVLLTTSALTPLSSVKVFAAAVTWDILVLGIAAISVAAVLYLILSGVVRAHEWKLAGAMLLMSALCLSPVLVLNRVSELYAYAAMPFVSIAAGIAAGHYLHAGIKRRLYGSFHLVLFGAVLVLNTGSVLSKASLMSDCGKRASSMLSQVAAYAAEAPNGSTLVLSSVERAPEDYSIFRISGFGPIEYGEHVIKKKSGREDLTIIFSDIPSARPSASADTIVLVLKDGNEVITSGGK